MIKDDIKIIKKFFNSIKSNKKYLFMIFICLFVCSFISIFIPYLVSSIVGFLTSDDSDGAYLYAIFALILSTIYFIFNFINKKFYIKNYNHYFTEMHNIIFNKIIYYDENEMNKLSKGKLFNVLGNDINNVSLLTEQICELIISWIKIFIIFIICCKYNAYMAILLILFDIIHLKTLDWYNKNITKYTNESFKSNDNINDVYDDIIEGYKEIKSYNLYNKMNSRIDYYIKDYQRNFFLKWKYLIMNFTFFPYLLELVKYILYIYLIYKVLNGDFAINDLILIITYYEMVLNYSETFLFNTKEIRMKELSIDRFNDIVNNNLNDKMSFGTNTNDIANGNIKFNNVSFGYSNKKKIIKNINLDIKQHKITAITGRNGSGKSTLAKLLLRSYKVDDGKIFLDNTDIYDYSEEHYNKTLSILYQKPFLFNLSIKENLSFANSDFNEMVDVCKIVGIHEKIMSFEKGYDTIITKDGNNISGGEKQLLCLARILLLNPKIIIFDEITNFLDLQMQTNVIRLLEKMKEKHTIILITHDPKILKISDQVVLVDSGEIIATGSHNNLLEENLDYQQLIFDNGK